MEDFGNGEYNEALQQTAVILALTSKPAVRNDLLLGLYYSSLLATPPQTRYSYRRPVSPAALALGLGWLNQIPPKYYYPSLYSYCPPSVWAAWSPLQRSLWIESALEYELRDYEYRLRSINDDLIRDLKREMERAKED
jgi:hypothetical protein